MNAHLLTNHLTEDDLDEVLLGFAPAAALDHTAGCPDCQARLAAFRSQLAVFNQASADWSVARSNTLTRDLAGHRAALRLTPATLWYSTVAAILAVALSFSTSLHRDAVNLQSAGAAQAEGQSGSQSGSLSGSQSDAVAEVAPGQGQLASDNAMLAAIDSETAPPPMDQFGLQAGYREAAGARTPARSGATFQQVKE